MTPPKNQLAHVLSVLIESRANNKAVSQLYIRQCTDALNVTARISDLRDLGLIIHCSKKAAKNRYGQRTNIGLYFIASKSVKDAVAIYQRINK